MFPLVDRLCQVLPDKAASREFSLAVLLLGCSLAASAGWASEIIGLVNDDAGHPVTNVLVSASTVPLGEPYGFDSAFTDVNGEVRLEVFDALWAVEVDWRALSARGYRSAAKQFITVSGADERVDWVVSNVVFTAQFHGRAINDRGEAISNTMVSAFAPGFVGDFEASTHTDDSGRFELRLFGGRWYFGLPSLASGGSSNIPPNLSLWVVDGVDQTNVLLIARTPTARVLASVKDGLGSNVPNAYLTASTSLCGTNYNVEASQTDSNGLLRVDIFESAWHFYASADTGDTSVAQAIPEQLVVVTGSQQVVSFVARTPASHLRGRVLDELGAPVLDATVSAFSRTLGGYASIATDTDGRFDLKVSAGTWRLQLESASPESLGPSLRNLTVTEGMDRNDLQLVLRQITRQISGLVRNTFSNTVSNVSVEAEAEINGQFYSTSSFADQHGNFRLKAFDAPWQVKGDIFTLRQAGYRPADAQSVSVGGTNAVIQFVVAPLISARLRGRVVDARGAPVGPGLISVYNSGRTYGAKTPTGTGGSFDVGVFGGSWTLVVDNFQAEEEVFLGPRIPVAVEDGVDQTDLLLISPSATAQIFGAVSEPNGQGLAGLVVLASTEIAGTNYLSRGCPDGTDSSGRFRLAVFDSTWKVVVADRALNQLGFQSLPGQEVTVAGTSAMINFVAQRIVGDGTVPRLSSPLLLPNGAVQFSAISQTAQRYRIDASPDLREWVPMLTNDTRGGSFLFTDSPATNAPGRFYRAVLTE